jgi:hypothetical protein
MRTVIALSVALLGSLVGSYFVWTYEGDALDASKVPVYVASENDVQQLSWTTDLSTVTLSRKQDDRGEYIWVEASTKIEVPQDPIVPPPVPEGEEDNQGDETPAPAIEPEPVYETQKRAFMGGMQATDLMAKYSPLQAIRELPTNSTLDMGMSEPAGTIGVTRKSGVLSLVVGKETFGGKQRFLKENDRAYLINKSDVRSFENPEKLMEGRLHPVNRLNALRIEVSAGDKTRVLERQNAADVRKSFWASPDTPETKDKMGETWVLKALDIKTKAFVQDTPPDNLTDIFTMNISDGKETWSVVIMQAQVDEENPTYFGKSPFTRGLVKLNAKAADASADLAGFLTGEES